MRERKREAQREGGKKVEERESEERRERGIENGRDGEGGREGEIERSRHIDILSCEHRELQVDIE